MKKTTNKDKNDKSYGLRFKGKYGVENYLVTPEQFKTLNLDLPDSEIISQIEDL